MPRKLQQGVGRGSYDECKLLPVGTTSPIVHVGQRVSNCALQALAYGYFNFIVLHSLELV